MSDFWNPNLYAGKHSFVQEHGTSLILLLDPKPHEIILDVGCGTGELTAKLAESAKEVVGIDASSFMIDHAKSTYPNIDFKVENATNFTLHQTFDAIFSNAALHWVQDYEGAIQCMYGHLKPGGRLVLEMGGHGNISTIETALREVLAEYGFHNQSEKQVWYFPFLGQYTSHLENAGFKVSAAWLYDRPTPLKDSESGIADWITMFGQSFLEGVPEDMHQRIAIDVQERIRPVCYESGTWIADYKRLRVVAEK